MAKKSQSSKKWSARRFAPVGLWLAGLAVLAAASMLVLKVLIYIGIYVPTNQKFIAVTLWVCLGLFLIGPALFALLDPGKVRTFLSGRQARHGSNAVIMLIAFALILIVANVIVFQNPAQWDLTEDQQNSLAPETIATLKALPAHVHAIGFFTARNSSTSAEELFKRLQAKSSGKFDYEFVDPESKPAMAQQYDVTRDGTVVLTMQNQQQLLTSTTEQNVTNALVLLMNPGQRTVYFLTGHGERGIENASDTAYTRARQVLESKNYTVKTLNLLAQNQIPEDALAVIISGPIQPISSQEMTLLSNYVAKGGALVALEDPAYQTGSDSTADPLLDYLAAIWGITVNNDLVIDQTSSQLDVAVEYTYGSHTITDSLESRNLLSFYPDARSLTLAATSPQDVTTTALVETSNQAWGETDLAELQSKQVAFDPSTDFAGPLTLAAAAENSSTKGRVVVIGDSDFADDTYFDSYGNGDMLINSIDWAAAQENMISLTAKSSVTREMVLPSQLTMLLLAIGFVIVLPGLVVAGWITSWLMRRSRG